MRMVHKVEIDRVSVYYTVTITMTHNEAESVREVRVRDDGDMLFIQNMSGGGIARIVFKDTGRVTPDKDSALVELEEWARDYFSRD